MINIFHDKNGDFNSVTDEPPILGISHLIGRKLLEFFFFGLDASHCSWCSEKVNEFYIFLCIVLKDISL